MGQQEVGLGTDLVRGAVVDLEAARAALDVDAGGLPGERRAEDPLADVAGEEQPVGPVSGHRRDKMQLGDGDVLGLVHEHVDEGRIGHLARQTVHRSGLGFLVGVVQHGTHARENAPELVPRGGRHPPCGRAGEVVVDVGVAHVPGVQDEPPLVHDEAGVDGRRLR